MCILQKEILRSIYLSFVIAICQSLVYNGVYNTNDWWKRNGKKD